MAKTEQKNVAISEERIGMDAPIVVSEVLDRCLYSGFFGRLDSARIKGVSDRILEAIQQTEAESIIIDLSNVDFIDSAVAAHLIKVGDIVTLMGTYTVFCGINPTVAQSMVYAGVEFRKFMIYRDLKSAINGIMQKFGLKIVSIETKKKG